LGNINGAGIDGSFPCQFQSFQLEFITVGVTGSCTGSLHGPLRLFEVCT
jgi:hypothetical protein